MNSYTLGWVVKTDINGNERWRKLFGRKAKSSPLLGIDYMPDGGVIVLGETAESGNNWSAYVQRLNACGERDWCRIYRTPGRNVYGLDIQTVPQGGSLAMVGNWGYDHSKTLWLLRLDEVGDIVWEKAFCLDTTRFLWPEAFHLQRMHDSTYVITGLVYSPDSGQVDPYKMRALLVKVGVDGNTFFELPWGTDTGFEGMGVASIDDQNGNIYSGIQGIDLPANYVGPCLIKTSSLGQQLFYHNLVDSAGIGGASTINWFQDSTLAMGLIWRMQPPEPFNIGVIKTNRQGNRIKYKPLVFGADQEFNDAVTTYDNKLAMLISYVYQDLMRTFIYKVNSELEDDSIYTGTMVYDSLCPHPIVSDTIPVADCQVVVVSVGEKVEKEKTALRVYPNPAKSRVVVELPEIIENTVVSNGITVTTRYHQKNRFTLQIHDLRGRIVYREEFTGEKRRFELDISGWSDGFYVASLHVNQTVVGSARFLIER